MSAVVETWARRRGSILSSGLALTLRTPTPGAALVTTSRANVRGRTARARRCLCLIILLQVRDGMGSRTARHPPSNENPSRLATDRLSVNNVRRGEACLALGWDDLYRLGHGILPPDELMFVHGLSPRALLTRRPRLVHGRLRRSHGRPGARLGAGGAGGAHPDDRPHRQRQDPRRFLLVPGPPGDGAPGGRAGALPGPLRLAPQGTGRRRRAEPPGAAGRPAPRGAALGPARSRHRGRHPVG